MPTYRLTVTIGAEQYLLSLQRAVMKFGSILSVELVASPEGPAAEVPLLGNAQERLIRNQEIVELYQADPVANSSVQLADRFGISRERVCQILRRPNVIADKQLRKSAARESLKEQIKDLTAEAVAKREADLIAALNLVREGKSIRHASVALGYPAHSGFNQLLRQKAKATGVTLQMGKWRDFSARRTRVRELLEQGLSPAQIVNHLRANGDPHLHLNWIYVNMREFIHSRRP